MRKEIEILADSIKKVIVGKDESIRNITCSLLCKGHVLLEDVPGVGKTQLISALAKSLDGKYNRIQLTPDVMPSDIVGFTIINQKTYESEYRDGAAVCNFLLADEINRASPKVQSSLLEVMEENQISLDGVTRKLPQPFMVLATQNPVETYGTYHLPEAQMDRFFMKISLGYPTKEEESLILKKTEDRNPIENIVKPAITLDDVIRLQDEVKKIDVCDEIRDYILNIVFATRNDKNITLGISPRGSISLFKASKAIAFVNERSYVIPDDVKTVALSVLSHRVILSVAGKNTFQNAENYISYILTKTAVPMGGEK